ncbi:hypothetical protein [Floridanema evergladense]|uniref:Uncharacterized protein n=1 Tax=Floridaenema evergladense BLCC-F167 TaxID=3153639 RepID=A0ABV4WG36_9CYAN
MDITEATKNLNSKVQQLKSKFTDPVSTTFIEFYCQCKEGCDYLFPPAVKESIRLLDIVQWFFDCIEKEAPTTLVELMWKDIVGPTLGEYQADEAVEQKLLQAFQNGTLKNHIQDWDMVRTSSGSVNLILRGLLTEISRLESEQKKTSSSS